jgi:methionyl-tRNA synthetase
MADAPSVIQYDDFAKLDLRVGKITEATEHPNADKLLLVQVDLGSEKRQLCAGLRGHYEPAELVGKSIIVVANLAPRNMRGEVSQGMLLAASSADSSRIIVLTPDGDVEPGSRVS